MLYNMHMNWISEEHYPIEYQEGSVIFFGRKFMVTPDVLIPRLETESLIRHARALLRTGQLSTLIDIGTWSGIIPTSCGDLAEHIIAIDLSSRALWVAEKNFFSYFPDKNACFLEGDLLTSLDLARIQWNICITANLPYIRAEDWEHMSADTQFEPKMALFGWEKTGFELYEAFFEQLAHWSYTYTRYIIIEFGFDQREIAAQVLSAYPWKIIFFADYSGIERFAEIQIPPIQ